MRMTKTIARFVVLAVLAMVAVPLAIAGDEQSLGEVAKQKSSVKAKKVITDEDLPSTSSSEPPPTPSEAKDTGSTGKEAAETSQTSDKAKSGGTTKVAALQNELDSIVHDEELLKKKLDQLHAKADAAVDPFRKNMYEESIQHQQVTLQEFRDKRRDLERQLAEEKEKVKPKN